MTPRIPNGIRILRSSLVTVTFPTRRPKRLARRLQLNTCRTKERDWLEAFLTRDGHVTDVRAVCGAVEVDIWLGEPRPYDPAGTGRS